MTLVKVSPQEIKLGAPLEFSVYSVAGKLLLSKGYVLESVTQLDRLFDVGAFRDRSVGFGGASVASPRVPVFARPVSPAKAPVAMEVDFPAMVVKPEAFLLTIGGGAGVPLTAKLVGVVNGQGLLITIEDAQAAILPGTEVEVKIVFGRNAYQFSSTVLACNEMPFGIVTLDYPRRVKKVTLRQYFRVRTDLTGRLLRNDGMTSGFDASLVNISLNGVRLSLSGAIVNVGEHFQLSVRLCVNGRAHAVMLNCVARNCRRNGESVIIGAEFGALSDDTRRLVKDFVFEAVTDAVL